MSGIKDEKSRPKAASIFRLGENLKATSLTATRRNVSQPLLLDYSNRVLPCQ
jgi:hypothetical protein